MKKKTVIALIALSLTLTGCGSGVSQDDYDLLSSQKDTLQESYNALLEEKNKLEDNYEKLNDEYNELLEQYEGSQESAAENVEESSVEASEASGAAKEDMQARFDEYAAKVEADKNKPDDREIVVYAQSILEDYYPKCKVAVSADEYDIVNTGTRYKIEGDIHRTEDAVKERFAMVIRFTDEDYEAYKLISLQIGSDKLYFADDAYDVIVSEDEENGVLTVENAIIYNEVMDALSTEPDREESEILEEIAPNYGMTVDELSAFIYEFMEAYYE